MITGNKLISAPIVIHIITKTNILHLLSYYHYKVLRRVVFDKFGWTGSSDTHQRKHVSLSGHPSLKRLHLPRVLIGLGCGYNVGTIRAVCVPTSPLPAPAVKVCGGLLGTGLGCDV